MLLPVMVEPIVRAAKRLTAFFDFTDVYDSIGVHGLQVSHKIPGGVIPIQQLAAKTARQLRAAITGTESTIYHI